MGRMEQLVKKFAYRIYDLFRGPIGYTGQAGEKGDPGPSACTCTCEGCGRDAD